MPFAFYVSSPTLRDLSYSTQHDLLYAKIIQDHPPEARRHFAMHQ